MLLDYNIDVSDGEFELIDFENIKWTMPEVEEDTELTLTVDVNMNETVHTVNCINVPAILSGPTSALETKIIDVIITNYDADLLLDYNIDVSDGDYFVDSNVITWTMPEVEEDTELTLTVGINMNETVHTVNCRNMSAILSGPTSALETKIIDVIITNYDADLLLDYNIDVSDGDYFVDSNVITWTMPEVEEDTELTLTVGINMNETVHTVNCRNMSAILSGPTSALETTSIEVIITNYDEDLDYSIDVSDGDYDVDSNVITWTMPEILGEEDISVDLTVDVNMNETVFNLTCEKIVPILSGPTSGFGTKIIDVIISNYIETFNYVVGVSDGECELVDDTIHWVLPDLTMPEELTLTVNSVTHNVMCNIINPLGRSLRLELDSMYPTMNGDTTFAIYGTLIITEPDGTIVTRETPAGSSCGGTFNDNGSDGDGTWSYNDLRLIDEGTYIVKVLIQDIPFF